MQHWVHSFACSHRPNGKLAKANGTGVAYPHRRTTSLLCGAPSYSTLRLSPCRAHSSSRTSLTPAWSKSWMSLVSWGMTMMTFSRHSSRQTSLARTLTSACGSSWPSWRSPLPVCPCYLGTSSKQQGGIYTPHVASLCFKCFTCFIWVLQVFHRDVAKVDHDVAHVAMLSRIFQVYVPNVLSIF
jgi:hypothetical protein